MLNDDPAVTQKKWKSASPNYGANRLINEAPVDELLTIFHGKRSAGVEPGEIEFLKTVLLGRYVESSVKSMNRLTEALNKASKSSTIIGWGLVIIAIASVVVAALGYLK